MARDHPFTFLDHAIKCGDSLVGLTNKQIAAFHWNPSEAKDRIFGQEKLEEQVARVAAARRSILEWTEDTEAAVLKKRDFLAAADSAAASLKTTGDLVIAAFFAGDKPKQRQQNRDEFLHRHLELQKGDAQQILWEVNTLKQLRGGEFPIRPFHWEIEFPEVFSRENPGFDAIVGNPPFLGGKRTTTVLGTDYRDWLTIQNSESSNNADLVVFFFRFAYCLLRNYGALGLVSTNSISEGDNRASGLLWLCSQNAVIYDARTQLPWPGEAAVVVNTIAIHKGDASGALQVHLNGRPVSCINPYLLPGKVSSDPARLAENKRRSFIGFLIYGSGFLFADNDRKGLASPISLMRQISDLDPRNCQHIHAYLGGDEFLNSPTQSHYRYVIDLSDLTESEAKELPNLYSVVEEKVKPERLALDPNKPSNQSLRKFWWKWGRYSPEVRSAMAARSRLLFHPNVSAHLCFGFIPNSTIVGAPHVIIALDESSAFAILQSRVHELWAYLQSSSLGEGLRYTPTDCVETFPFPENWESNAALEEAGKTYYEYRAKLMVRNDEGLTKTYNRFHDPEERSPDILRLRELHAAMDRAVLDAYGWTDIPTECQFLLDYEEEDEDDTETTGRKRQKKRPWRYRWPDEVRDEVLARLLALNAERAEEERRAAAAMKPAKQPRKKTSVQAPVEEPDLFTPAAALNSKASALPPAPGGPRPALGPASYFEIVIPLLAERQPEGIRPSRLLHMLEIMSEPEVRQAALKGRTEPVLKEWSRAFPKTHDFSSAAAALMSLVNDGTLVRYNGAFQLAHDAKYQRVPWLEYDAKIALLLTENMEASQNADKEIQTRIVSRIPALEFIFSAA